MTELSGLEVMVLVKEIGSSLSGAYVAGVYSLGDNQILKFKHPAGEDAWLVASPRYGAWVSKKVAEKAETTGFTSRLRGEIERLRFSGSDQVNMDRVFSLALGEGESLRRLLIELMPPGNIVVVDGAGRMRLLLREVRSERRRLVRGGSYSPPPQSRKSPWTLTAEEAEEILRTEKTAGRAIGRGVSLPRKYVREALSRMGLDEGTASSELMRRSGEIVSTLREMVDEASDRPAPSICETPDGEEIFVVKPTSVGVKARSASLCDLCDEVFLPMLSRDVAARSTTKEGRRREIEATLAGLERQERENRERASKIRELAGRAMYASSTDEATKLLEASGVKVQRRAPASREAVSSFLFASAKELEKKADDAHAAYVRLGRKGENWPEAKPQTRKITRKSVSWYEKFRWFFTSGGKLAVGGRDAQSNELLVKRHVESEDTVYHADIFGSPFFVLKEGKSQTPEEIQEVAQATVSFSSAWKTGLGSADAYWVNKDQVSSSPPSGEYLSRGSFLIRGKKNMVGRNLVEVALGIDGEGRVISGPESAIAKAALCHIVLTPHREKASETAKKVARELSKLCGRRASPSVDDVLRALPAGGGKILRARAMGPEKSQSAANL